MKKLSVLGSTGSIGTQTLDVVRQHPNTFQVVGLAALNEVESVLKQIQEFNPIAVHLAIEEAAKELEKKIKGKCEVFCGEKGLVELAKLEQADTVVVSVVGAVGVKPTLEAIKAGKNIALANKETLVSAGEIVMKEVEKQGVTLLPIDSEHSAIFQCLNGENKKEVEKIILTCSGGSFKGKKWSELEGVSRQQALNHPTWSMGGKITIDSATLMNKGFEVIEAHWLYNVPYEKIEVVVHPESIIHSMVEFVDGSIMAQIGVHDMRIPIQYALSYPKRLSNSLKKLDLIKVKQFNFEEPDLETFKCLKYAFEAGKQKGTATTTLNAANDESVFAFLNNKIKFLDIPRTVGKVLKEHKNVLNPELRDILKAEQEAKQKARKILGIE